MNLKYVDYIDLGHITSSRSSLDFKLKMKRREKLNHYMNSQNICGKSTDDSDLSFIET